MKYTKYTINNYLLYTLFSKLHNKTKNYMKYLFHSKLHIQNIILEYLI